MEQQVYFITGIDTGCGKTYTTGLVARALKEAGISVITQKLVQTGCSGISEDILEHRRLMGCGLFPEDEEGITCPYVFSFPSSPHLAAKLDHKIIDVAVLMEATQKLSQKYNVVLIEGAGGLHVPLTENILTIDYIRMMNYPVILVSSSKLGSINQTLLSIESCFNHQINLHALLYNKIPGDDSIIADDTFQTIKKIMDSTYPNAFLLETNCKDEDILKTFKHINNQINL